LIAIWNFDPKNPRRISAGLNKTMFRTDFAGRLTAFPSRVQLQQVILNLIMNAVEAMSSVTGRERRPCASMTDLQMERPKPIPWALVVKKGSKMRSI
jgi:nitrogen fixation/metabolism regulation signal transduction histidine kinase